MQILNLDGKDFMFGDVSCIVVVHKDGLTVIKSDGSYIDVNKDNVKNTVDMLNQQFATSNIKQLGTFRGLAF